MSGADLMPIEGVVFDKDGTLFDYRTTWEAWAGAVLVALTNGDRARAAELGTLIGYRFAEQSFHPDSIVIAGTPDEIADALRPGLSGMTTHQIVEVLNEEAAKAPQAEAAPLIPLLTRLRDMGLKLGVATNDGEAPAMAHLASAGVDTLFDFIAGSDSGHGAKPGPGQLNAFCRLAKTAPEHSLMVGDSLHDLMAGQAAGMRTIGVLTGMATQAQLASHAHIVLPDISHLPAWIADNATTPAPASN